MGTLDEIDRSDLIALVERLTESNNHREMLIKEKNSKISILLGQIKSLNKQIHAMKLLQQPLTRW